jgi:transposase
VERQYVAIDLHRLRSLIVREDEGGNEVGVVRIDNDPVALSAALADAGPNPQVAIEASYGWYWAVDVLEGLGAEVRLVNPSGLAWGDRRVKNDYKDCKELLDRMRLHKLPEAWIAPSPVRELRELVRYRHKLVCLRTALKAQVKAVLAKHGLHPPVNDLWGLAGTAYLNSLDLDDGYHIRIESLRDLVEHANRDVAMLERVIHQRLRDHAGYRAIQAIDGVGPILAAIFVTEIGDVGRFPNPEALCSWAGLTPKHRESDTKAHEGGLRNRARCWCDGAPSRRLPAATAGPSCAPTTGALPPAGAPASPRWPWHASSSRSSTSACATARCAASPRPPRWREPDRTQPRREFAYRHDPPSGRGRLSD